MTPAQRRMVERLADRLGAAEEALERRTRIRDAARAQGIDTSTPHGVSAASSDHTVAFQAALVDRYRREYETYVERVGGAA